MEEGADSLASSLSFNRPKDVPATEDLLGAAQCIDGMPNVGGLDLGAPQWRSNPADLAELVSKGVRWQQIRSESTHIHEQAWDADLQRTRQVLDTTGRSFLGRLLLPSYRRAQKEFVALVQGPVSGDIDQRLALLDTICEEQQLRADINSGYPHVYNAFGRSWNGHDSDWTLLSTAVGWWLSLLDQADAGVVRYGSVQLLCMLESPHTHASVHAIALDLTHALQAYQDSFERLYSLLDAAEYEEVGTDQGLTSLPFSEQRQELEGLRKWAGLQDEALQDKKNASKARRNDQRASLDPHELVGRINGRFAEASTVFGNRWAGHDTDWSAVIPPLEWWASLLRSFSSDQVAPYVIRSLQQKPSDMDWRHGLDLLLGRLNGSLEKYEIDITRLQTAMDLDNQVYVGNSEGLASLPLPEQQRQMERWNADLPYIQDIVGFNSGAEIALAEGLHSVTEVAEHHPEAGRSLTRWFECAWFQSILESAFAERPALSEADGQVQEARIERFKMLDQQSLAHNMARVKEAHWAGPARLNDLPKRLIRAAASSVRSSVEQNESLEAQPNKARVAYWQARVAEAETNIARALERPQGRSPEDAQDIA